MGNKENKSEKYLLAMALSAAILSIIYGASLDLNFNFYPYAIIITGLFFIVAGIVDPKPNNKSTGA